MRKRKQVTKLCYVIMPFSKTKTCSEDEWTDIFEAIIKPSVEGAGLGYRCVRSEATTGNMIKKIVQSLYQANVVIADLTDRNPNVFYELGVRHTLQDRTIMIAQRRNDIPSDLHSYASHVYKWKTTAQKGELTKKLRRLLEHIELDTHRSDNPVSDFLQERSFRILEFQREENSRKLRALTKELNSVCDGLRRAATGEDSAETRHFFTSRLATIDHLVATQYVYNDALTEQAMKLSAVLEIVAGRGITASLASDILLRAEILKRNAEMIFAAHQAGDPIHTVQLEAWPPLDDGP